MRRQIFLLILTVIIFPIISHAGIARLSWPAGEILSMSRENPVIDASLNITGDGIAPVWVFFTDKGIADNTAYAAAIGDWESKITPANYERRLKTRGKNNIADFRDLPANDNYVKQILETGVQLRQNLRWFNAVSINATAEQIQQIAAMPFVRYIKRVADCRVDHDVELSPIQQNSELVTLNYGASAGQLNQINVVPAHELGFKGQGIIICMMDVGYKQSHDAFQNIINSGRLIAQYDFINHDYNTDYDSNQDAPNQADHGTLTWSTLGGESSGNLYGPSYMASFILAKTEDVSSERHIEEDNWAAGAEWADSIGASVISSSLGYRIFDYGEGDYQYSDLNGHTTIVAIAASLAAYNGITVCNAMGNEGNSTGSLISPADADSILSCGAVNSSGTLASFSSWGPTSDGRTKPEVCAQGVSTVCADPYNYQGYTSASGTSLSTPLVGGSAGVLLSAHPNWTPVMVREALMMTADRYDSPGNDYGSGIMDVSRALYYHPQGDILFNFMPLAFVGSNQQSIINASVTGGAGISHVYLYYRGDENGYFTEIDMATSDNINFSAQIPGQTGGTIYYYLKAVDSNGNFAFNPIDYHFKSFTVTPGSTVFTDSFEGGLRYWKSGGANNFWGLTATYAMSGNLSITDSPTTDYRDNTNSWLESLFSLDLRGVSDATLSFYWRGILQSGHDTVFVETSTNGGSTWNRLSQHLTGTMTSFSQYNASLNSYLGQPDVRLRFHFVSDASTRREGIYIDEIQIAETRPADISVVPTLVSDTLAEGQSRIKNIVIRNSGGADLFVNMNANEFGLVSANTIPDVLPEILNTWLFVAPEADTIISGDSLIAQVTLNASSLTAGNYSGQIDIASNDPDSPLIQIPVALNVEGLCQYILGDANGNGTFNGIDVTYSVGYFKGGPVPPYSCNCSGSTWFVAGDVNGNCAFNGIDVSYMVSYFKGGSAPIPCPQCPPTR